jgi:hypothetical protein
MAGAPPRMQVAAQADRLFVAGPLDQQLDLRVRRLGGGQRRDERDRCAAPRKRHEPGDDLGGGHAARIVASW